MEKCKAEVFKEWRTYRCSRNSWKDGFCKQHHPDIVKAREEESRRKYIEQSKNSPSFLLGKANNRIFELEAGLEALIDIAERCDGWESFPSAALDKARDILGK